MIVMKFGGVSVGNGQKIQHVANIVKHFNRSKNVIMVVSAMHGVTDKLIEIFNNYKSGDLENAYSGLNNLYQTHIQAFDELNLTGINKKETLNEILNLFQILCNYLSDKKAYSANDYDFVVSFGERLSSSLLTAALNNNGVNAKSVDAAKVIVADGPFSNGIARIEQTKHNALKVLKPLISKQIVPVITGFFGGTSDGHVITLGRGGSDYSATIIANVLDVDEVILWKEVDGVYSEDPKVNCKAEFYKELSYTKALRLAQNGAKILHPEAMKPVAAKEIIIRVKNTFKPEFHGTKIWKGMI